MSRSTPPTSSRSRGTIRDPQDQDSLARSRFLVLTAMRASGVALMLLGMGIIGSRLIEPSDIIGGIVFMTGFLDSLILPRIFTRKWRSPRGS